MVHSKERCHTNTFNMNKNYSRITLLCIIPLLFISLKGFCQQPAFFKDPAQQQMEKWVDSVFIITTKEFAEYSAIEEEIVMQYIND